MITAHVRFINTSTGHKVDRNLHYNESKDEILLFNAVAESLVWVSAERFLFFVKVFYSGLYTVDALIFSNEKIKEQTDLPIIHYTELTKIRSYENLSYDPHP